ncbi:MAG: hypothetical protein LUO81_04175 [Methanoregulaceae archaeon]|nr:hypothetical protein [Methanoregulaceae archaeon]
MNHSTRFAVNLMTVAKKRSFRQSDSNTSPKKGNVALDFPAGSKGPYLGLGLITAI